MITDQETIGTIKVDKSLKSVLYYVVNRLLSLSLN